MLSRGGVACTCHWPGAPAPAPALDPELERGIERPTDRAMEPAMESAMETAMEKRLNSLNQGSLLVCNTGRLLPS